MSEPGGQTAKPREGPEAGGEAKALRARAPEAKSLTKRAAVTPWTRPGAPVGPARRSLPAAGRPGRGRGLGGASPCAAPRHLRPRGGAGGVSGDAPALIPRLPLPALYPSPRPRS